MTDHFQLAVYQTVHAKLLQNLRIDLLRIRLALFLCQRIRNVVIQNACRNDFFIRIMMLCHLCHCIHINHQLELQAIVKCQQIK